MINNWTINDVDLRKYNQEYKDTNKFIIDIKPKKYDGTYRFILLSTLHIFNYYFTYLHKIFSLIL